MYRSFPPNFAFQRRPYTVS